MLVAEKFGQGVAEMPRDYDCVTVGFKPSSAELHTGHWVTADRFAGLLAAQPDAQGLAFVDDRQWDHSRLSKTALPARMANAGPMAAQLRDFMEMIGKERGGDYATVAERTRVVAMSDYMKEAGPDKLLHGSRLFEMIVAARRSISEIYPQYVDPNAPDRRFSIVRPLCPRCDGLPDHCNSIRMDFAGKMHAVCEHGECASGKKKGFAVQPKNPEDADRWGLHYVFAAARDLRVADSDDVGVVHVYGADYLTQKKEGCPSNAERMNVLMDRLSPKDRPIHHYIGPLVVREDGEKVSKSDGDMSPMPTAAQLDELNARMVDGVIRI